MPDLEIIEEPLRNSYSVDCLECFPRLVEELHYMGIKTIKEFKDNYQDIMVRILGRYPDVFDDIYNEAYLLELLDEFSFVIFKKILRYSLSETLKTRV